MDKLEELDEFKKNGEKMHETNRGEKGDL